MIDQAAPLSLPPPRLRLLPALLWRLVVACLLGTLAFLPYDLSFFVPGTSPFLNNSVIWYGPNNLILTYQPVLLVEAFCLLLILAAIGIDHRLRHQTSISHALLLTIAPLLALDVVVINQSLVRVWLVATFSHGLGGIPLPFDPLPFFFVALVAAFLVSGLVQEEGRWKQISFFTLVGLLSAGVGLLLHLLVLSLMQHPPDGTNVFIYDLWLLLPLTLILGVMGGLLGGTFRLGVARYFSAPAETQRVSKELAPAAFAARLGAVAWRLMVAGAAGALPMVGPHLTLLLSLNHQQAPLIEHSPFGFAWLVPLFPWLLIAVGMLIGQEAQQNGSALARIGAGLLAALLILGTVDILITFYVNNTLRILDINSESFLTETGQKALRL
jgi:hypothetical protein